MLDSPRVDLWELAQPVGLLESAAARVARSVLGDGAAIARTSVAVLVSEYGGRVVATERLVGGQVRAATTPAGLAAAITALDRMPPNELIAEAEHASLSIATGGVASPGRVRFDTITAVAGQMVARHPQVRYTRVSVEG